MPRCSFVIVVRRVNEDTVKEIYFIGTVCESHALPPKQIMCLQIITKTLRS